MAVEVVNHNRTGMNAIEKKLITNDLCTTCFLRSNLSQSTFDTVRSTVCRKKILKVSLYFQSFHSMTKVDCTKLCIAVLQQPLPPSSPSPPHKKWMSLAASNLQGSRQKSQAPPLLVCLCGILSLSLCPHILKGEKEREKEDQKGKSSRKKTTLLYQVTCSTKLCSTKPPHVWHVNLPKWEEERWGLSRTPHVPRM